MNELVTQQQSEGLAISSETKELIQSSIADSTLRRYQRRIYQTTLGQGKVLMCDTT